MKTKQKMTPKFKYFNINEMLYSPTAEKCGIDNVPKDERILDNIYNVLSNLDNIREVYGKPIIITSGYRCPQLNAKVGGKSNSQHLKGEAADLKFDVDLLNCIIQFYHFDQLITEKSKNKKWIHISFLIDKDKERNKVLNINV